VLGGVQCGILELDMECLVEYNVVYGSRHGIQCGIAEVDVECLVECIVV